MCETRGLQNWEGMFVSSEGLEGGNGAGGGGGGGGGGGAEGSTGVRDRSSTGRSGGGRRGGKTHALSWLAM